MRDDFGLLFFTNVSSKKKIKISIVLQLNFYSLFFNWDEKDISRTEFSNGAGQGKQGCTQPPFFSLNKIPTYLFKNTHSVLRLFR